MASLQNAAPVLPLGSKPDEVRSTFGRANRRPRTMKSSELRACPFCRELFTGEASDVCPECGIKTQDLAKLPPSPDAEALIHEESEARGAPLHTIAQSELLPWNDMSAGRGPLLVCALAGFAAFFLPWAHQTLPETVNYSAYDLAKAKSFFWAVLVAWVVLFPGVLSRRNIVKLLGARPACVMLSLFPLMQCVFLFTRPTRHVVHGIPFEHSWSFGFWLTVIASVGGLVFSLRLGKR